MHYAERRDQDRDLIGFEGEWSSRNGEEGRESTSVETKRQVPESRPVFPQPSEEKWSYIRNHFCGQVTGGGLSCHLIHPLPG